jgi:SAM-dependent methyltransferase
VLEATRRSSRLLDLGAGTGTAVEDLCNAHGVAYYALDVSADLLGRRSGPQGRKLVGRAECLPVADEAFDVTFSRAVTAWNSEPVTAIGEQLRVTAAGGTAIFTEFDWTRSGMTLRSQALADGMAARAAMMAALSRGGFMPRYGASLGRDIDLAACAAGLTYTRQEHVVELPVGDHRKVFLDAARNIIGYLRSTHVAAAVTASMFLESCARAVENARTIELKLPTIVTQVVRRA